MSTATATNPKDKNVSNIDVSKLSFAELTRLMKDANERIEQTRVEEIKVLADAYAKKTTAAGFTIQEAIEALHPYMPATTTRKRGPNRVGGKQQPKASEDKDGHTPEMGASYKHPTTGEVWKKESNRGAAKKDFITLIQEGKTWNELRVK